MYLRRRSTILGNCALALIACLAARAAAAAAADVPVTGADEPKLAAFDKLMSDFVRDHDVPGAAMAIARGGRIVYARGFGYADVERRELVDPDALFRIASISKPFTAAAVLQLQERGKLRLDDPGFDLPGYTPRLAEGAAVDPRLARVTIRQLLNHTGGFDRAASFDPMFRSVQIARLAGTAPPAMPRQIIEHMMGRPLDFDPGGREAYSNFGYCVLGRAIERASGVGYEAYVQRELLAPLGITRMRLGRSLETGRAAGEVRYYPRDDRRAKTVFAAGPDRPEVPVAYGGWCLEAMDAHGGWIASAPELVRFASSFDEPGKCPILKADSIAEMFRRPPATAAEKGERRKGMYYAAGWAVRPVGASGKMNSWHNGRLDGTSTLLVRRFDGLTWAVLFNADADREGKELSGLIDPLLHPIADGIRAWPEGRDFAEPVAKPTTRSKAK